MESGIVRFDRFTLDPGDRRLRRDGAPVELNGRYFDALALLIREQGKLVTKDRFLDEVWRGVPVTDEALTQCVKTLRRQLDDDASRPRFIETVPKHGYRFIAPVEWIEGAERAALPKRSTEWQRIALLGLAGTIGGGFAGAFAGLFYGLAGASEPLQPGMGAISMLLVLVCLSILAALIGAVGVSFGIAASDIAPHRRWYWPVIGGATGGMVVGSAAKLLGLDAFNLLFGQSPGDITGGAEGAMLGAAVGLGVWLAARSSSFTRAVALAGLPAAIAGMLLPLLGGRMLGGSLDLLARGFPNSRLRLDQIGALFGEQRFGLISQSLTGGLEGLLFGACIAAATIIARRNLEARR